MSVNHQERLTAVVAKALKEAALGEAFGFAVNGPGQWPLFDPQGQPVGMGPAWFVLVTIRGGLGEPDIGNGFPVPGVLPADEAFRQVAVSLLERCRMERDKTNSEAMAAAKLALAAESEGR